MIFKLLTRDEFRTKVFARDKHKCLMCDKPAVDAHHILERSLFPNQGFYLENGASVCAEHHIEAEQTLISCEKLRELAGIREFPLPPQLTPEDDYDKWGNPLLPNGQRLRGELFNDLSVQKILTPVLHLFTDRVKYPRTWHFPWSPGATADDRILKDLSQFEMWGVRHGVVATEKVDGECTTMGRDYIHARSTTYDAHPSRSWVKALQARIGPEIPEGWRICGENLYATHSIHYEDLEDYFLMFSIWDQTNHCLTWHETKVWAELLGLKTVPVLYEGPWDEKVIRKLHTDKRNGRESEGYVVRLAESFHYKDFRRCVGKYVRAHHVQTDDHWKDRAVLPNKLKPEKTRPMLGVKEKKT